MNSIKLTVATLLLLAGTGQALADWGCTPASVVKASHAKGQALEKNGKLHEALSAYLAAQDNACTDNPLVAEAAKRAAAVALPLGDAARAKGDHAAAFDYYERGGHFKAADQSLIAWTTSQPDDVGLYEKAFKHFEYRTMPAFRANEAVRLATTSAYTLDSSFVAQVNALPKQGMERTLIAEAAAFNEAYLQKRVALAQSMPENPVDFAAQQLFVSRSQALATQFPKEYLQDARQALSLVQRWASASMNPGEPEAFEQRMRDRAQIRFAALTQTYWGDPSLLDAAKEFAIYLKGGAEAQAANIAKIKAQAEKLGDTAEAKGRLRLAIGYYDVADADEKEQRANQQLNARAMQQMHPAIDEAKQSAAAIATEFSDPNKVADMKRQAQKMQRALQQSAAAKQAPAMNKSRDDLAKELGM